MTPSEKRAAEQVVEALRRVRNLAADATTQPLWHVLREMGSIERIAAAALAAWDAESGGERPGNGVEGLTEPSPSALTHGVSGRSPALPADPAAVPPATSPASGQHDGGGAPAEEPLPEWSRGYRLVCPRCERIREAVVEKYAGEPWPRYVHECACGYVICESEWNEAPASEELLEQPTGLLDDLARQMGVETPAERKEAK